MEIDHLDYSLPPEQIAQTPCEPRDAARLLVALDPDAPPSHRVVADLPDLLAPGDLLVVNETRVIPARLRVRKPSGGLVEVLLLEPKDGAVWEALVGRGKVAPGTPLHGPDGTELVVVGERVGDGAMREVTVVASASALLSAGVMPVPPYIHTPLADPERYQTVYAATPGSAAAPTAGLHLTHAVLERCRERGIGVATVDLAIGLDTFKPITAEDTDDHVMHSERYTVPAETLEACARTRAAGGRVVAVGTTAVRALESAAATGERTGRTRLFITAAHQWRLVDILLTNFHLPRTSLLVLVDSFVGPRWRDLYAEAVAEGYRFLSFGDAMLLARRPAAV